MNVAEIFTECHKGVNKLKFKRSKHNFQNTSAYFYLYRFFLRKYLAPENNFPVAQ